MSDIIIYGRGKTGQSIYKMLKRLGKTAFFYDDESGFDENLEFSKHSLVILSPGVTPYANGVMAAQKVGAKVIGELEFCLPYLKGQVVSVTGTNGKTTTCEMIRHILQAKGRNTYLLGNGGVPLSEKVLDTNDEDIIILENSSFQLAYCDNFAPYISVFTNLACDHINYHGSFDGYRNAKINNFVHQNKNCYGIFNADDAEVVKLSEKCSCKRLLFSIAGNSDCIYDGTKVVTRVCDYYKATYAPHLASLAKHNLSNALASILVCKILGINEEFSVQAIRDYKVLPHRLQTVESFCGVTFVDDSKATNVHATLSALTNYNCNLALILGGSSKCESFEPIFKNIRENVQFIVAVGETADEIVLCGNSMGKTVTVFNDIRQAVAYCYGKLKDIGGGTVLMSNACASFDKFKDYAERGNYFQKVVRELHSDEEEN